MDMVGCCSSTASTNTSAIGLFPHEKIWCAASSSRLAGTQHSGFLKVSGMLGFLSNFIIHLSTFIPFLGLLIPCGMTSPALQNHAGQAGTGSAARHVRTRTCSRLPIRILVTYSWMVSWCILPCNFSVFVEISFSFCFFPNRFISKSSIVICDCKIWIYFNCPTIVLYSLQIFF